MLQKVSLGLEEGRAIVDKTLEAASAKPGRPEAVAVVDNAGALISFAKMDGATALVARMAIAKAQTVIYWGRDTRTIQNMLKEGRDICWFGELDKQAPIPGGVPIRSSDGSIIGAVGTSGRSADEDEELALAGASVK